MNPSVCRIFTNEIKSVIDETNAFCERVSVCCLLLGGVMALKRFVDELADQTIVGKETTDDGSAVHPIMHREMYFVQRLCVCVCNENKRSTMTAFL